MAMFSFYFNLICINYLCLKGIWFQKMMLEKLLKAFATQWPWVMLES